MTGFRYFPATTIYGPIWHIPVGWGRLIVKWRGLTLFSEREGITPSIAVGPLRITYRRWN